MTQKPLTLRHEKSLALWLAFYGPVPVKNATVKSRIADGAAAISVAAAVLLSAVAPPAMFHTMRPARAAPEQSARVITPVMPALPAPALSTSQPTCGATTLRADIAWVELGDAAKINMGAVEVRNVYGERVALRQGFGGNDEIILYEGADAMTAIYNPRTERVRAIRGPNDFAVVMATSAGQIVTAESPLRPGVDRIMAALAIHDGSCRPQTSGQIS